MKRIILVLFISCVAVYAYSQDHLSAVREAWSKQDYPLVVENATKHLAVSPKSVEGYYYRGMAYMSMETYGNAISDLTFAIKYWTKKDTLVDISAIYGIRAKVHILTGDTVSALKDCTSAIKSKPDNQELYVNRAVVYESLGQYAKAEADYKEALKLVQYDVKTELRIAYCQKQQGKTADARATLQRVVKMNPRNEEALREIAMMYRDEKNTKRFVDYYVEFLELTSDGNDEMLVDASHSEYDYTVSAIEKMIAKTKYKKYWLSISVKVDMANGHYDKAVGNLKEMEKILGDSIVSPFVYYRMALCYNELGEYTKAVNYYTKLIEFEEQDKSLDVDDIFGRGICYESMGSFENAMADYNRAIVMKRSNVNYLCRRGVLHEKMGNPQAAKNDYDKAIASDKNLTEAYLLRGKLLIRDLNDTVAAMNDFNAVLRLDTVVKVGSCRAQALHFLGKADEAQKWMDKMQTLAPADHRVCYAAACLYALNGKSDSVVAYLKKVFEMGRFNYVQIQKERDFDNVRQNDDFQALLKEYSDKKLKEKMESIKQKQPLL